MARTREGDAGGEVGLRDERADGAGGAWLTMPAKMMKLMPLPMPRSVMSSPIHIRSDGARGQRDDLGQRLEAGEVEVADRRTPSWRADSRAR